MRPTRGTAAPQRAARLRGRIYGESPAALLRSATSVLAQAGYYAKELDARRDGGGRGAEMGAPS
jgi:hypothetical protein